MKSSRSILLCALFVVVMAIPAVAQDDFHVFPQIAYGTFSDGAFFRSTLTIDPFEIDASCTLILQGLSVDFGTGVSSSFVTGTIPEEGFVSVRTAGTAPLATGYATLTCDKSVFAEVTYSFYSSTGVKLSEATVFSSSPSSVGHIISDGRDGARLAVAIANDTDIVRLYDLTLRESNGNTVSTGSVEVGARSNFGQFVDEMLTVPAGQVLMLEIQSADSSDFSAIGLRFTGGVFTTVPAN